MSAIAITGATGFIGSHLVWKLINNGYQVRILARDPARVPFNNPSLQVVLGDITQREVLNELCKGCNVVIHLASATGLPWRMQEAVNINGTQLLLEVCEKFLVPQLIYFSSLSVYAGGTNSAVVDEAHELDRKYYLRGDYAKAKYISEQIVREFPFSATKKLLLRPGFVYGCGMKSILAAVGFKVKNRLLLVPGSENRRIPLVHVDDLAEATLLLYAQKIQEGTFNVVGDFQPEVDELMAAVSTITGKRFTVIYLRERYLKFTLPLIDLSFRFLRGKKAAKPSYQFKKYFNRLFYDNRKLKQTIHWQPRADFETELRKLIKHAMMSQGCLPL